MANSKKKSFSTVADAIVTALLIVTVALCAVCLVQVNSKGYASIMGYSFFRVATGSMEPTLPVGTLLVTKDADVDEVELNDIICFRSKDSTMLGQVITHRVVEIIEGADGSIRLLTKGDANLSADGYYVSSDNMIGKVIWNSKEGSVISAVMSVLNSQIGFLLCIVFPVLLIASFLLHGCVKHIRSGIDEMIAELESEPAKADPAEITQEEYMEIYNRVKEQLLQEFKDGEIKHVEISQSGEEPGEKPGSGEV